MTTIQIKNLRRSALIIQKLNGHINAVLTDNKDDVPEAIRIKIRKCLRASAVEVKAIVELTGIDTKARAHG